MIVCSWEGFIIYIFAFTFFLLGIIVTIPTLVSHINFGLKKGFFYKYNRNKLSNNPFTNILFFGLMIAIGVYALYDAYPNIIKYWKCLKV